LPNQPKLEGSSLSDTDETRESNWGKFL